MKQVKVKVTWDVLQTFFHEGPGIAFAITSGLPDDAKMVAFRYAGDRSHIATFESEQFEDIEPGNKIPMKNIEYIAYEVTKPTIIKPN